MLSIPADLLLFTTFIATTTLLLLRNLFQSHELARQRQLRQRRRHARLNPDMDLEEDLIPEDSSVDQEARITNAIRAAALLRQKLPADLVPIVLDYAQLWSTIAIARRFRKERINERRAGLVALTCKLPENMPGSTVRRLRITTESRDQGWSDYLDQHGTYEGSWTWFELGVRPIAEQNQVSGSADEGNLIIGREGDTVRRTLVTRNIHARRKWKTHVVVWDVANETEEIRKLIWGAKAGDVIELSVWARYPGWENFLKFARIEVEGVCVRRL